MFFLALRHLTSKKKQTALTLVGIILGTAAYVAISGMMLGFQTFIIDQLVNNDAHVRISAKEEKLTADRLQSVLYHDDLVLWQRPPSGRKDNSSILAPGLWIDRLEKDQDVDAFSPQLVVQVIVTRGHSSLSARLVGADAERQRRVTNIENYMVQGKFTDMGSTGKRLVAGKELLERLGASLGDTLFLSSGKGNPEAFRVVGMFRLGIKNLDEGTLFTSLHDAQQLNRSPSRVSDIALRLREVTLSAQKAASWNALGQDKVQSWDQSNEGIMSVFKMQDIVRNSMTISILLVAGFGIYNILSLAITHKRREIAILRSMGFWPRDISWLFLIQGLILGLIGGIVGLVLGYFVCLYLTTIEVSSQRGLGGNHLLVNFDSLIYWKGFLLALVSCSLASFFPARAAGKLEPIEIIRGEAQ
jgi:lipoprotein-releasing system permease protein